MTDPQPVRRPWRTHIGLLICLRCGGSLPRGEQPRGATGELDAPCKCVKRAA